MEVKPGANVFALGAHPVAPEVPFEAVVVASGQSLGLQFRFHGNHVAPLHGRLMQLLDEPFVWDAQAFGG